MAEQDVLRGNQPKKDERSIEQRLADTEALIRSIDDGSFWNLERPGNTAGSRTAPNHHPPTTLHPPMLKRDMLDFLMPELSGGNDLHMAIVHMYHHELHDKLYKDTDGNRESGDVHRVGHDYAVSRNRMGHTPLDVANMALDWAQRHRDKFAQEDSPVSIELTRQAEHMIRQSEHMIKTLERYLKPRQNRISV